MTTFVLIRHGESMANAQKAFAGHLDIPLSALGEKQAQVTADHIVSHFAVDAVYTSDLRRAFDTGKAVADRLGLPITPDTALREISAGDWEGVKFDKLETDFTDSYRVWLTDIGHAVCDNGESVAQLQTRFLTALRRIAREHDGQTVVIATHATPIRCLQCAVGGHSLDEMKTIPWVTNASVTVAQCEQDKFRLISVGYDKHLANLRTFLPANV